MIDSATVYRPAVELAPEVRDQMRSGLRPDMSVLRQGRRAPPVLPLDVFGPWEGWIVDAAEGAGAAPDYVVGPLLAALSAVVGNCRAVSPWEGWVEPAVLWVGSVGDPSSTKSPGADPVLDAVGAMERERASGFEDDHRRWLAEAEAAKAAHDAWKATVQKAVKDGSTPPPVPHAATARPEPVLPRIIVNDATPEALSALLAQNPRGALHYRDELAGWLASFERYSAGSSRAFWIEAYGARPFTVDRVKHGSLPLHIPRLSVSTCGGIQPDKLAHLLSGADDGLASRFIWVWPEPLPPRRPTRVASPTFIQNAFRRLLDLDMPVVNDVPRPVVLRLNADAADLFQEWRVAHASDAAAAEGLLASFYGKLPGMVLRLALLLELGWWAASASLAPSAISAEALSGAVSLVEVYMKPMSRRVYGDAARSEAERRAGTLAGWIIRERPHQFNAREVRRTAGLAGLREAKDMAQATEVLVDANWLFTAAHRDGDRSGRHRTDYIVNPKVYEEAGP